MIPKSVTSIDYCTFYECTLLNSVTIPESVTSIGECAFGGCIALVTLTIPESVTFIDAGAFRRCSSLTSVTIPESVTIIGVSTFYSCSSLTSMTIPESVISIGSKAFSDCSSLASVTIPKSVRSIGEQAFSGCVALRNFYSLALYPPVCGSNAFEVINKSECTLFVPCESINRYATAVQWWEFLLIKGTDEVLDDSTFIVLVVADPAHGAVEYQYPLRYEAKFSVKPASGWMVETVTFNGEEIESDEEGFYSTGELN